MWAAMEYLCTVCQQRVSAETVDVGAGLAYCSGCDARVALQTLSAVPPGRVAAPSNTRIRLERTPQRLEITLPRGGLRGVGCFFLFFSTFWNGVIWTVLLASLEATPIIEGPESAPFADFNASFDTFTLIMLIPFVLIGLITASCAVFLILSDCRLVMDLHAHEIVFERRLPMFTFSWKYSLARVTDVMLEHTYTENGHKKYGVGIQLHDSKPIAFGSSLSDEEKQWLIGEITDAWLQYRASKDRAPAV